MKPQNLPNFPQTDFTDPTRANPVGTLWAQSPEIPQLDCHVGGSAVPLNKIITGTLTNPDGTAVGFVIDDLTYSIADAADAPDFVSKWNAKPAFRAVALASVPEAGKVKLELEGLSNPTITSYTPGGPDFDPIVVNQAGSDPKYIKAGRAVVRDATDGEFGAVTRPGASTTGDQILGVALRSNMHTGTEAELLGFESGKGDYPGSHLQVITGGYPKVELSTLPGAALMGGLAYVVIGTGPESGTFRSDDGGRSGTWTFTFSAANGTDAVGAYFNGLLVALGGAYAGAAVNATNATNFAAALAAHPVIGPRFTVTVLGAVVTAVALDRTAWSVLKYKPVTSDVTVANTVAAVAATAVQVPNSRWGKPHAANATGGYLELHV